MFSTEGIKNKEVINICDGRSLGFVCDIEINLEEGCIEGIILPGERSLLGLWGRNNDECLIRWKDIKIVGEEVILVEFSAGF